MIVIAGKNNIAVRAVEYLIENKYDDIAVVCNQTDNLDAETRVRQEIAVTYAQGIANSLVRMPIGRDATVDALAHHAFHLFVVRVKPRAAFLAHLKAAGIDTLIHYPIPPHQQQAYTEYNGLQLPLTEAIHKEVVSLPIGPTMSMDDVQEVIAAVNTFAD
jgi:dTDP-4-amino-4,6-dideoxygalactose transaminase